MAKAKRTKANGTGMVQKGNRVPASPLRGKSSVPNGGRSGEQSEPEPDWRIRIVGHGVKAAAEFTPHPDNARTHPEFQRRALRGSLAELGWVAPVIINRRTGRTLDGHLRVEDAVGKGPSTPVPYIEVDVDEEEEPLFLAAYDYITGGAEYDRRAYDSLLAGVRLTDEALNRMLAKPDVVKWLPPPGGTVIALDVDLTPGGLADAPQPRVTDFVATIALTADEANDEEFKGALGELCGRFGLSYKVRRK